MKVLHVPFTYAPDAVGGTEVYVAALARELTVLGIDSAVAAPATGAAAYDVDGVPVRRFGITPVRSAEDLAGEGDVAAAAEFGQILNEVQPDVVHLHARTPAVSLRTLREAHRRGVPVVYTYHTPTGTCPRGTLLRWGRTPCDGRLLVARCAACVLHAHGVPRPVALALASTPGLGHVPARGRLATALRTRRNVASSHRATRTFLAEADQVVVPCTWAHDLMQRLGVPHERLSMSRQGLPHDPPPASPPDTTASDGPLRVVFVGRLDHTKGLDTLLDALALRPDIAVRLDVLGIAQAGAIQPDVRDPRVRLLPPVAPGEVVATLRSYDVLAVPSRWLETGPLVVLEAFAAGVPVLGSRLGGIAELVTEGRDGILVPPDDPAAWAEALARMEADPAVLTRLRAGIHPPRRMADAANDMAALYHRLLSESDAPC